MRVESNTDAGDFAAAISNQYGPANLGENILTALKGGGKDTDALTRDDLAGSSEFHIGGRPSTIALAKLAGIKPGMQVIDLGSGLGGPATTLASEFGAEVTAVELSTPYHNAARLFAEKVGVTGVTFINGSALDVPAEDESFDVVWMQHAQMNIEDKERLFAEIRRVLKPGGVLAWHGILRGSSPEPVLYPITWADTEDLSFLVDVEGFKALATDACLSLDEGTWTDMNQASLDFFKATKEKMDSLAPEKRLGLNLVMGPSTQEKLPNLVKSITSDRLAVYMAVFRKVS